MSTISGIAAVRPEEWSESAFKKLHLEGCCSPNWIRCLLEKWISGEITARVFTDQWPDCTCVVILYHEWLPTHCDVVNNDVELIATSANKQNSEKITHILGRVIDWNKANLFVHGYTDDMAKAIADTVHHPLGREHGCIYEGCSIKRYSLTTKEQTSQQQLSDEFYNQQLEPCHAEYIAQYWGYWSDLPSIRTARFLHGINSGDSVGIFTKTTPTKLVAWAIRDASGSFIHHLYTLEEYRGRGLASAVVREMCKKIQNKGEVPFTYIAVGNEISIRLFEKIGFKENPGLYRIFLNYVVK